MALRTRRTRRTRRTSAGFTLIELMIVVAIVGILAAVAIPALIGYVKQSKASEAFNVLQGVRDKEEAYYAEFKRYTGALGWMPYTQAQATAAAFCSRTTLWAPTNANFNAWRQLGFHPGGPTYYTYQVVTNVSANTMTPPVTFGTSWPVDGGGAVLQRPWFQVQGFGDIDCNGITASFWITSASRDAVAEFSDRY